MFYYYVYLFILCFIIMFIIIIMKINPAILLNITNNNFLHFF